MSGYTEEKRVVECKCGATNHVVIAYAGDYRANERESEGCYSCGDIIVREKCWCIHTGPTPEDAIMQLRKLQNRA